MCLESDNADWHEPDCCDGSRKLLQFMQTGCKAEWNFYVKHRVQLS